MDMLALAVAATLDKLYFKPHTHSLHPPYSIMYILQKTSKILKTFLKPKRKGEKETHSNTHIEQMIVKKTHEHTRNIKTIELK